MFFLKPCGREASTVSRFKPSSDVNPRACFKISSLENRLWLSPQGTECAEREACVQSQVVEGTQPERENKSSEDSFLLKAFADGCK